ncbi:MAG: glutamate-1-semialdehyde 2,1-aminomutase [Candidatus Korobacteraceae bacterium]
MARSLQKSRALQKRAEQLIPGGVNSPVRAFRSVGSDPPFLVRGEGARVWDADGNRYIDYVGSWGPLILGHADPQVIEAIVQAARNGTSFGASTPTEAELAALVVEAFPAIEKVRFVSSGTEATMSAIRLARAATKRKIIVKFEGCYHGHSDALLVKAGSGVATLGIPGSAGVPEEFVEFTLALPYNDVSAVEAAFAKFKGQIACVIVEPVVGNMGCVLPQPGYLEALREITAREDTLLIFDEVMTGFRVAFGGASELYHIKPDLTTLGKIIGGGLPVGAYGGPAKTMDLVAPVGPVYQAGTLSGNPLAMAAGIATVCQLKENREDLYRQLDENADRLVAGVIAAANEAGVAMTANRVGSMFTFFFTGKQVTDWESAATCDTAKFGRFHGAMLDAGVWLPPSQFEAAFLSTAHMQGDIDDTIAAAREALALV